jgi:hypothetical protein
MAAAKKAVGKRKINQNRRPIVVYVGSQILAIKKRK